MDKGELLYNATLYKAVKLTGDRNSPRERGRADHGGREDTGRPIQEESGGKKQEGLIWLKTPPFSVFKSVFPHLLQVMAHKEKENIRKIQRGNIEAAGADHPVRGDLWFPGVPRGQQWEVLAVCFF